MKYAWLLLLFPTELLAQTASFTAPDTVCVNDPVVVQNTSAGVGSYFWNFCSGSLYNTPVLESLGNPGGQLNDPVFTAIAKEGDDYFVFVVGNTDRRLLKLSFGNSLLNSPVASYVPNVQITLSGEGIQLVEDAAGYHLIVVGGTVAQGSRVQTISFGASLSNTPVVHDWGNIGGLAYPTDLYTFYEGGNLYGFTSNFENGTITLLNFGSDLSVSPTGTNLGTFGGSLSRPAGIFALQENNQWYLFIVNEQSDRLTRLDFGASLLNTPTAVDLGNPGNAMDHPRDISFIRECGVTIALVVNGSEPNVNPVVNQLTRLDFAGGSVTGDITGTNLGNPGGLLNFASSLSSLFRVDNELYAFIPNVTGNTLSRLSFESCSNASIPNSTLATPPVFSYNTAGTYTINLITDEGSASQRTFCRTVVVLDHPVVDLGQDRTVCNGVSVTLDAGTGANVHTYTWNNGSDGQTITVNASGTYGVTVFNGGCAASGDVVLNYLPAASISSVMQDIDCMHPSGSATLQVTGGTAPYTFSLNGSAPVSDGSFDNLQAGNHAVLVTDNEGCEAAHSFIISEDFASQIRTSYTQNNVTCQSLMNGEIRLNVTQGPGPYQYAIEGQPFQASNRFPGLPAGVYKVYARNSECIDSQQVTITEPPRLRAVLSSFNDSCSRGNGSGEITIAGGTGPYTVAWDGVMGNDLSREGLGAGDYEVRVVDAHGCDTTIDYSILDIYIPRVNIINEDTTIHIGETIELKAENAVDYLWEPMNGTLSCQTCSNTMARPVRATEYIVRTVTGRNCILADTVLIQVTYDRSFRMPNAFSPNGDGMNDRFRPKVNGMIIAFNMLIYNRWGEMIAQITDCMEGWDGTYKGVKQPVGTYVYQIQYAMPDDEGKPVVQQLKGSFTLVR